MTEFVIKQYAKAKEELQLYFLSFYGISIKLDTSIPLIL